MSEVEQIRSFNRFYTRKIGLLAKHLPQSNLTLAEARILYELAQTDEQTAAAIIRTLGMDKAHASRIVARFDDAGLLTRRVNPNHGKQKLLSLTAKGRKTFRRLNQGTLAQIAAIIEPLTTDERERLTRNMRGIQALLQAKPALAREIRFRRPRVGELSWIAHRQAILYQREYGWDWTYEGLALQILGDFIAHFDEAREDAWTAEIQDRIVGSVFLMKTNDPEVAKLRLLYVEPESRGLGVGRRLVRLCLERAREMNYQKLTLWTNDVLVSARKIYQAAGFQLLDENPHRSFGKDLIGQTWELDLREGGSIDEPFR
jgi:DNA-binding MarR family transcriptional regulator/N-acetylglutamate synthase-like GNAT family acetyltransferase